MDLGVIGVGNIAAALLTGLATGPNPPGRVLLSPRNAAQSAALAARFATMRVAADNQAVLDGSAMVILAVRPQMARAVLAPLRFRPDHRILSLIAIHPVTRLAPLVAPASRIARALPLPPVARHQGPLAYSPPDPDLATFFAGLGSPIPVADDRVFETLWSCSAMIATLYRLVAETAAWATAQGVPRDAADRYAATMTHAIAQPLAAADADPASLAALAQTPGGLNAQVLDDLTAAGQFTAIHAALDRVRARLDAQAASDG